MSAEDPWTRVTVGSFDSELSFGDANFLKVKKIILKRNATQLVRTLQVEINNDEGIYNSIEPGDSVSAWASENSDGSGSTKIFSGKVVRITRKKSRSLPCLMGLECRDNTMDLLNTNVTETITIGETKTGGDSQPYVMNDYANLIKYLMSFSKYNPSSINYTTYVQSGAGMFMFNRVWNMKPTFRCLQDMATLTNWSVYMDYDNNLHFEPKNNVINSTELNTNNNVMSVEEDYDNESEKNMVYVYAGQTIDGTNVTGHYSPPGISGAPKITWRRNINIAPSASGTTAADRLAAAQDMAKEFAQIEYEKLTNKHFYRATLTSYISCNIGDIFKVTDSDLGLNQTHLQAVEVEETFEPSRFYGGVFRLNTVVES